MAESCASFWLMPPSSAGASSYEDKANSYTHDGYSAALDHGLAPRVGDGDARHIAMKIIRMRQRKSISPINSYAESNKGKLWRETAVRAASLPGGRFCTRGWSRGPNNVVFDCCGSLQQRPSWPMARSWEEKRFMQGGSWVPKELIRVSGPGGRRRPQDAVCTEAALSRDAFA